MPEVADRQGYNPNLTSVCNELIFGIVRPVGVDRDRFVTVLTQQLTEFGYEVEHIRLSLLLSETYMTGVTELDALSEADRTHALISAGD